MDKTTIDRLRKLRKKAKYLGRTLVGDLKPFRHKLDGITFRRKPDSPSDINDVGITTTCSCLMALAMSGKLRDIYQEESKVKETFDSVMKGDVNDEWISSKLDESNAFTTSLVLRAFGFLKQFSASGIASPSEFKHEKYPRVSDKSLTDIVKDLAENIKERFIVNDYPATPTIVYWFIDAVERSELSLESWQDIFVWASHSFFSQFSRVSSKQEALMDPIAMAMATCLLAKLRKIAKEAKLGSSPSLLANLPSKVELGNSIHTLFKEHQSECGIWPKYFPLFHYPDAGSNYCFAFEMLEAILNEFSYEIILKDENDIILKGLEKAVKWCDDNRLEYLESTTNEKYFGWNSGGQLATLEAGMPESWATAVVHMFLHKLQEVLTDKIEKLVFDHYNAIEYEKGDSEWKKLIDIDLKFKQTNEKSKVKDVLHNKILSKVIDKDRKEFRSKPINHKRSALLFGPPGTSKTSIVKALAQMLGWPLIIIEPSHFLSKGLEKIYSEADSVFEDLSDLSGVIVLFDEMDALVRTREGNVGGSLDVTSRFLTTSMLPKLARLHDDGQIIFFMATNYQAQFDPAIKRPGRFDMLLCMWPPSWKNKVNRLDKFIGSDLSDDELKECQKILLEFAEDKEVEEKLDRFTFDETKAFFEHLCKSDNLRTVLDDKPKAEFKKLVKDWSQQIILNEAPWEDGRKFKNTYEQYNSEKDTSCLH